jgi:hypothetical protein
VIFLDDFESKAMLPIPSLYCCIIYDFVRHCRVSHCLRVLRGTVVTQHNKTIYFVANDAVNRLLDQQKAKVGDQR